MFIVKYIFLAIVVCLTLYLVIDTIVFVVRKIKEHRKKVKDSYVNPNEESNDNKTE